MDILDHLILQPFKQDYLLSVIVLFNESEVYSAICMGIIISNGFGVKINFQ